MATENKTTFKKEDVRRVFGDEVADKIGNYQEATGGGTPLAKGEKLKDHPEAKRVMQPRDEEGKFTYNAVNEKPLKYGPSRGTTPMPIFDSIRSKFKKKANAEYSTNEEDGLKKVKLNMSFEDFEKRFKEFHTEEGWTGFNVEISSKKGRRTKEEEEAVRNNRYGPIMGEFEKEKGNAKPKKSKFSGKGKPAKPIDEQPKQPKSESVDTELAKNNKQEFVEKYSKQIDDLMEYADSKGQDVVLDDIVEAFATGENTSFEEMKKEIDKAAGVDTTEGEKVNQDYQPSQEKPEKPELPTMEERKEKQADQNQTLETEKVDQPVVEEQKEKNDIQPVQETEQTNEDSSNDDESEEDRDEDIRLLVRQTGRSEKIVAQAYDELVKQGKEPSYRNVLEYINNKSKTKKAPEDSVELAKKYNTSKENIEQALDYFSRKKIEVNDKNIRKYLSVLIEKQKKAQEKTNSNISKNVEVFENDPDYDEKIQDLWDEYGASRSLLNKIIKTGDYSSWEELEKGLKSGEAQKKLSPEDQKKIKEELRQKASNLMGVNIKNDDIDDGF